MNEESRNNDYNNNNIDQFLEIVNDLTLIERYPNMAPFLTVVKKKREERLSELLLA